MPVTPATVQAAIDAGNQMESSAAAVQSAQASLNQIDNDMNALQSTRVTVKTNLDNAKQAFNQSVTAYRQAAQALG